MTQTAKVLPLMGPFHPLISAVVKQHVQRCHFPPESLLLSVSEKDSGRWVGCEALQKPLKAQAREPGSLGTGHTARWGQTQAATSLISPFLSFGGHTVHSFEIDVLKSYRATEQDSGVRGEQTIPLALSWPYTLCVCVFCAACCPFRRISFRSE